MKYNVQLWKVMSVAGQDGKRKDPSSTCRVSLAKRQKLDSDTLPGENTTVETDASEVQETDVSEVQSTVKQGVLNVNDSWTSSTLSETDPEIQSSESLCSRTDNTKGRGQLDEQSVVKNEPYLCSGYDMYVTREPCTM